VEFLAGAIGEPSFLPAGVIGGAEGEQDVIRIEFADSVRERSKGGIVADHALGCGLWGQPFELADHRP